MPTNEPFTRTTCYLHLASLAAETLGMDKNSNPDDVFRAIIAKKSHDQIEIARAVLNRALGVLSDTQETHG